MKKQHFSLVELLVVIGIIVLLAGLMIPAVMSSKTKGQITEAKADMAAIKMALTAVERDYKTILRRNSSFDVHGGQCAVNATHTTYNSMPIYMVRYDGTSSNVAAYNALIRELTVPREITNNSHKNFNFRNIKYLDPREDYNPSDASTLWRDPWGNPYTILINTNSADMVYLTYNNNNVQTPPDNRDGNNMILRGKVFVYSWGPNGEDNDSFNADNGGVSTTDDIRGWEK